MASTANLAATQDPQATEKSYQKQPLFQSSKLTKKANKASAEKRWVKDVGLGRANRCPNHEKSTE
jgi:hypothetical protein